MKKILLFGMALLAMVSCKKYDDSELWEAVKKLQADTTKEEMVSNVVAIEKGAIKAAFSVGESKQVYFSQGNLQYKASTGVWRFAINQWDIVGDGNINRSSNYDGWIDLFGWGTSGWAESGANAYLPYSTNGESSDYFVGGAFDNNLTGDYANADWGIYNKIANGGNQAGLWRTLTRDEWVYVVSKRENSVSKIGVATVNGINGLILLPDKWEQPEGLSFVADLTITSDEEDLYQTINSYNSSQWSKMESAGAIFLPAGGCLNVRSDIISFASARGYYRSSTARLEKDAYSMVFNGHVVKPNDFEAQGGYRWLGMSVRLVQDVK